MRTDHRSYFALGMEFTYKLEPNPYSDLCLDSDWYYYEPNLIPIEEILAADPFIYHTPVIHWEQVYEPFPDRLEPVPDAGGDGPPSQYRIIK